MPRRKTSQHDKNAPATEELDQSTKDELAFLDEMFDRRMEDPKA